jgi:glyceraldehyde-3-phosphate dehydrogenase/erythrose-4-phosphate dehydrogenase
LHHELPSPAAESIVGQLRHRAGHGDHGTRLHGNAGACGQAREEAYPWTGRSGLPDSPTTGSDVATAIVLPALKDRLRALAIRVPVPDGAITDIVADLNRPVSEEEVNSSLKAAAEGPMRGILGYTEEELVSADIIGDPHSGIVHALSTTVVQGRMVKVQVWYDNEYGYSRRLLDTIKRLPV